MRFLVDAQLPRRVAQWLTNAGHPSVHTLDLPAGNRTPDSRIVELAEAEQRAVVTKDSDFVDSHLLQGRPTKLVLISTGNLANDALESLMVPLIPTIVSELDAHNFIELDSSGIVVRG